MTFSYFSNRAVAVFNAALAPLGGTLWTPSQPSIDLLYFDTYGGKHPPAGVQIGKQLMPRANTVALDQKHLLARRLID